MRYMTIALLLLVCFFGGMTYGSVETNHALEGTEEPKEEPEETMEMEPFAPEELETAEQTRLDEDLPIIHQMAAMFERIILSIYGSIIEALYQVANLFF